MFVQEKEKLDTMVRLVDNMSVNPDINIDYFIPGVLVTTDSGKVDSGGPYIEFSYARDGLDPHVQHMPLTHSYLEKTPQDLANLITFSVERFMEEIDSRQYGAQ
ncbi:MAG: hypothetical protein ACI9TV_000182 [Sulfurimonas sp.]|jgi:hypothetical protein|uniref:hypothetical protein n=1 Tax=Sulfurimonas sp. TaxID=2022749 RepID=UPI0039E67C09